MAKCSLRKEKFTTWHHLLIVSLIVNLRYLFKSVNSIVFRPTDKQFFKILGPWKSMLFHRSRVNPYDVHRMCLVLHQNGVQLL
jgi:hypothetical protein